MQTNRMAKDQPTEFKFKPESKKKLEYWVRKYPKNRIQSAVIPVLWIAQKDNQGWLSKPAIEAVAEFLNMPLIRVYEIVTFYTMFNLEPVGRYFIQLCGTTPCGLRGAEELKSICEQKIGPKNTIREDGLFSWTEVECLGACVNAPMVQINDAYYEDLTKENFARLLEELQRGRSVKPGSLINRQTSAPETGMTCLLDKTLYDGSRTSPLKKLPNAIKQRENSKKTAEK